MIHVALSPSVRQKNPVYTNNPTMERREAIKQLACLVLAAIIGAFLTGVEWRIIVYVMVLAVLYRAFHVAANKLSVG